MSFENLLCPVNLLQKHDACKHMRPCLLPKTEEKTGTVSDLVGKAVSTTQYELNMALARVLKIFNFPGKIEAFEAAPALIQRNDKGIVLQCVQNAARFICLRFVRIFMFAFNFEDIQRPLEAAPVFFGQIVKRPLFEAPDGDKVKFHCASYRCMETIQGYTLSRDLSTYGIVRLYSAPHLFHVVKLPNLGPEKMNHNIARIDHNPV